MHKLVIGIIVVLCSSPIFGQGFTYAPADSLKKMPLTRLDSLYPSAFSSDSSTNLSCITRSGPKRYLLAYQPGKAQTVNGMAIGVVGQDVICNAPYNQTTNGINLQIGGGLFHWSKIPFGYLPPTLSHTGQPKSITNGLQCSLFGTQTDVVNGLAVAGFVSVGERLNGIALNLGSSHYQKVNGLSISFRNSAAQTKGVQLGIFNGSKQLKGVQVGLRNNVQTTDQSVLQIGLWNTINGKSFPILNFSL